MTLQYISFALAVVLGLTAFGLVKYIADQYDRWYEVEAREPRLIRLPIAMISLVVLVFTAALFLVR